MYKQIKNNKFQLGVQLSRHAPEPYENPFHYLHFKIELFWRIETNCVNPDCQNFETCGTWTRCVRFMLDVPLPWPAFQFWSYNADEF